MKKNLFTFVVLIIFLCSCGYHPKYYAHKQDIKLKKLTPSSTVYLNNKDTPLVIKDNTVKVKRSSSDQRIIIEDRNQTSVVFLKSQITDEKWAMDINGEPIDAEKLLLPTNTYAAIKGIPEAFKQFDTLRAIIWAPSAVITGISIDVYNIVIGLPSTAISNPWYKYEIIEEQNEDIK